LSLVPSVLDLSSRVFDMEKMESDLKKMKEQLEKINRNSVTFKGKKDDNNNKMKITIQSGIIDDIPGAFSKKEMFDVIQDLYTFSKNAIQLTQNVLGTKQATTPTVQESPDFKEIIKTQLKEVLAEVLPTILPDLLNTVVATLPKEKKAKEETMLAEKHTLTVEKKTTDSKDAEPITIDDEKEMKGSLKINPVKNFRVSGSTATFKFSTKDQLNKAETVFKSQDKYKVSTKSEPGKKLDPKLSIRNIPSDITNKDTLLEKLLEKNEVLKSSSEKDDAVKVVFFDDKEKSAVIRVTAAVRESIRQNRDYVHIDLREHHVTDRIHVIQCYHCQEFGHMANSLYCKAKDKDPTCFFCAGNHKSKDCRNKSENNVNKIKCSNCAKSSKHSEKNSAKTHKASDNLCPSYVRERTGIMNRTAGCESSKNWYLQKTKETKLRLGRV
jgi:hypothetical protein